MTWEVIAKVFASKVVARKGQEISRKPMVKALMLVTPSIARWDNSMDSRKFTSLNPQEMCVYMSGRFVGLSLLLNIHVCFEVPTRILTG